MTLPELNADGLLPLGRWPASLSEIEARFVAGRSQKRQKIWLDLQRLASAMNGCVDVAALWLGGSFVSNRPEPGDADCVFIVDWQPLFAARADAARARFLQAVAGNQVRAIWGLEVDSFVLEWVPLPGPRTGGPMKRRYLEQRGYWDDLWSRARSKSEREDAVPRRGYLEVIFNGYA